MSTLTPLVPTYYWQEHSFHILCGHCYIVSTRLAEHSNVEEKKLHVFKWGFCTTPCKSIAGWRDQASTGCLCSRCLAAVLPRSLLTVTPSADLHHITKRLILFPADRMALQNSHQEDYQALLNTSSRLL